MRILFLTDNFPPESNAPASRTYEHAVRWVRDGHDVTVVTCAPNFPQGKVFDGYRNRLWQSEDMNGIRVIRLWSYMAPNAGYLKRVIDYLSFMFMAILAAPFLPKADVIVGTSPQFFTLVATWWASLVKRTRWVLELRDIWPESLEAVGMAKRGLLISALQRLEMFLYRRADRIVCVTHSFKRILIERGIDPCKIGVVTNGVDLSQFDRRPKDSQLVDKFGLKDRFIVGYVGTHGLAHGLETLLEAAQEMERHPELKHVTMIFVGDGARRPALEEQARVMGLSNVRFVGGVPKSEIARYWSLLDASIIHLRQTTLFASVIPSKIFECMGMGLPMLLGVLGEAREIVERQKAGFGFTPESANELVQSIAVFAADPSLLRTYSDNALRAAKNYDRSTLANEMLRELRSVQQNPQTA